MQLEFNRTLIEREIRSDVEKRLSEIIEQISKGNGVETLADYRKLTGYVAAFTEVLSILDAVRARISKQEGKL